MHIIYDTFFRFIFLDISWWDLHKITCTGFSIITHNSKSFYLSRRLHRSGRTRAAWGRFAADVLLRSEIRHSHTIWSSFRWAGKVQLPWLTTTQWIHYKQNLRTFFQHKCIQLVQFNLEVYLNAVIPVWTTNGKFTDWVYRADSFKLSISFNELYNWFSDSVSSRKI